MKSYTTQKELADHIIERLRQDPLLGNPFLHGSLQTGTFDRLSDIDISLRPTELTDLDTVERLSSIMNTDFSVEFCDWARSLLPDAAVVSFFLTNMPICWNIDFEIVVPSELRRGTREGVPSDVIAHDLKIWAIAFKYCLRCDDVHKSDVSRFVARFHDTVAEEWTELQSQMKGVLQSIESDADSIYTSFISRCWQTYEKEIGT